MADKTQANIGFEKEIWDAACVLWGHIPAAEYRKVIIGLIFLRYVSTAFERRYEELVEEGDGFEDDRDAYTMDNIFFVPEEARWKTIASAAHTPEIGKVIDNAMRSIEAENKTLKGVLPNNYANPDLDKQVLGDVVDIFTNMDMGDAEQSQDLLGRTYEYCIAQFAEKEGKGGGEFYTPASVVKTLVEILKPFSNCRVYDPCCGSGGMFVQSAKFIRAHSGNRGNIAVYGQIMIFSSRPFSLNLRKQVISYPVVAVSRIFCSPENKFRSESMCQQVETILPAPFPDRAWESGVDEKSNIAAESVLYYGIDMSADRRWTAIGVCGLREDGNYHIEVVARRVGCDWAIDWFRARAIRGPMNLCFQERGAPVAGLAEQICTIPNVNRDWSRSEAIVKFAAIFFSMPAASPRDRARKISSPTQTRKNVLTVCMTL